jgi:hypothetical protein
VPDLVPRPPSRLKTCSSESAVANAMPRTSRRNR